MDFQQNRGTQKKKLAKRDADVIDNLERMHRLRKRGAISDADFKELKEKQKMQYRIKKIKQRMLISLSDRQRSTYI